MKHILLLLSIGLFAASSLCRAESYITSTYFEADINQVTSYEYVNFRLGNRLTERFMLEATGNLGLEGDFYNNHQPQASYELGLATKLFITPLQDNQLGHYWSLGYNRHDLHESVRRWWYQNQYHATASLL